MNEYDKPEVCEASCCMVIGEVAASVFILPFSSPTQTCISENSGRYFATGSVIRNFPSSNNIIRAAPVIGLDWE